MSPNRYHFQGCDFLITDTNPITLSKSIEKSMQSFLAAPRIKQKKGWSKKRVSREKRSKRKSDDKGKRKKASLEGSPPSSPPQKRALMAIEDSIALALFLFASASLEGSQIQPFEVISEALAGA